MSVNFNLFNPVILPLIIDEYQCVILFTTILAMVNFIRFFILNDLVDTIIQVNKISGGDNPVWFDRQTDNIRAILKYTRPQSTIKDILFLGWELIILHS